MLLSKFAMGGYGAYVWSAYGITFFIFGMNILMSLKEKNAVKKRIRKYLKVQKSL